MLACELAPGQLAPALAVGFWGLPPSTGGRGDTARVTAAVYQATQELDGRLWTLVLVFIMKRARGSVQDLM